MLADHSRNLEFATRRGVDSGAVFKGMTHSGSPSLHDLLEESPTRMIRSRARGELWLPSPEGVQHGDVHHPRHDYATTGRDPGVLDCTNDVAANHYTNTPPRVTGSSPKGKLTCPTG
jgi:hypothetical protein